MNRILQYNEQKVRTGEAELLLAENFPVDAEQLSFVHALALFNRRNKLNENVRSNSLHISLNFDPSEKFSREKLVAIAQDYMKGIGFDEQPYLVYEHRDAGHPHMHIVTSTVRADGSRIVTQNIGRNQSEKARKQIELDHGLVKAEGRKFSKENLLQPVSAQKVQYGKSSTKRAINSVLNLVINQYNYTSLQELNAVLGLYNVVADRGTEGSRMYQAGGLVYHALDDMGRKIGTPIKASAFFMKPTLKRLEQKFQKNAELRLPHAKRLKVAVDFALLPNKKPTLDYLIRELAKEQIRTIIRQNKEGFIYGMTFVDFKTKSVFNGSDLGKGYSAKGILERCWASESVAVKIKQKQALDMTLKVPYRNEQNFEVVKLLLDLVAGKKESLTFMTDYVPYGFKGRRKKKRQRRRRRI